MADEDTGRFDILDGFPLDVVAVSAKGKIGRKAYEETLIPLVEARIKAEGKIKLYYEIGPEFDGYSAGAMWDDAKLGMLHLADFARMAMVTDVGWIQMGVKMFNPLVRSEMRVFNLADKDAAIAWISDNSPVRDSGPQVAADHKIAPLEDKVQS